MIKETTRKMHLLSYTPKRGRRKDQSEVPTVTVFIEQGRMQFPRYAVEQMQMNGKFVRFYYDPVKKIIAWKVETKIEHADMKLWKVCRTHKNGVWSVSIGKMIELFQLGKKGFSAIYRNVPIEKYREIGIMTKPNDTYFFIELKPELSESTEKKGV